MPRAEAQGPGRIGDKADRIAQEGKRREEGAGRRPGKGVKIGRVHGEVRQGHKVARSTGVELRRFQEQSRRKGLAKRERERGGGKLTAVAAWAGTC